METKEILITVSVPVEVDKEQVFATCSLFGITSDLDEAVKHEAYRKALAKLTIPSGCGVVQIECN